MQDVGQKQVAAVLGIQAARANTAPRPFLKLKPQHIAVQVTYKPALPPVMFMHPLHRLCAASTLLGVVTPASAATAVAAVTNAQ